MIVVVPVVIVYVSGVMGSCSADNAGVGSLFGGVGESLSWGCRRPYLSPIGLDLVVMVGVFVAVCCTVVAV